ncbi:MAG: nicotinamide-nucleotide amidohydrolase family protein [Gammaproteobacteria bacterium]|nr:MAG: nicotinamide-nucleotide amidohydrolase family protein [Gammaproteobacteria bacterium]
MTPDDDKLRGIASRLAERLSATRQVMATAESCTGGWIAKVLTDLPGSSDWFGYGIVSYSNPAKQELLGVSAVTLVEHGAVSEQVVREMAEGALKQGNADLAVAVSGVAGPTGGSPDKPVGTVWFAWAELGDEGIRSRATCHHFDGDREAVRRHTVSVALEGLLET